MLLLLLASALAAAPGPPTWTPLGVALECQSSARVDACTYLAGALDALEVVLRVPRSRAQVVLYVNATTSGTVDRVHLRMVGTVPGAPGEFEQLQDVDSRLGVDEQRAGLEPALLRALAPYIATTTPQALQVKLITPPDGRLDAPSSPWGLALWMGGSGWWTPDYQSLNTWLGAGVYGLTATARWGLWGDYNMGIQRQPQLQVDGSEVSLSSDWSRIASMGLVERHLGPRWSTGAVLRGGHQDPEGQYRGALRAQVCIERDWFPSDDPRGNRLAAAWLVGGQADWYNQTNTLGEDRAFFPTHMALASGSVRVDHIVLTVDLAAQAELLHPLRRHRLVSSGTASLQLGHRIDLSLSAGATYKAIPGPAEVDQSSYEEVTRASYAQPLELTGQLDLQIHWDPTSGARNNRFDAATRLDATGNL